MLEKSAGKDAAEFEGSSDRSFGLIFAAACLVIALKPLLKHGEPRLWAAALATIFVLFALFAPKALHPLNCLWMKIGVLLQKIMNPIIMGILFYVVLTPFALVARLFGTDPMNRKFDAKARSYWINRESVGTASDPVQLMRNQF